MVIYSGNTCIYRTVYISEMSHLPSNLLPVDGSPEWMNRGDNTWQLTSATLVGLQSVPGLVILYGSIVKKKLMGFELCLHGPVRFCGGSCFLGGVVLQNVIRREDPSISGAAKHGLGQGIRFSPSFCRGISQRHHGVLSVGFCCHQVDSHGRGIACR